MSVFVSAIPSPRPKTANIRTVGIACAAIITLMALTQLFSYEKFPGVLTDLWPLHGAALPHIAAALIVTLEVFSIPFLLGMWLSPAMRVASMVAGWLVVVAWFKITLWENIAHISGPNSALFGATLPLPIGWWSVLWCIALGILIIWASWGMWPFKTKPTK